jgi:hypothetical protein
VIKRIRFATRRTGVAGAVFVDGLRRAAGAAAATPPFVRPTRITVATNLDELVPDPRHDGVILEWFTDLEHVEMFDAWQATGEGAPTDELANVLDGAASPVVVADEHVLRGGDWLDAQWARGDTVGTVRLKHLALATRADGLTPAQFAERWAGRAGQVRGPAAEVVVIPEDVRGQAYVQNRPRPRPEGEWAYDAVNEVYLADRHGLAQRIEWFRDHLGAGTEADLIGRNWFLAVREEVLHVDRTDVEAYPS